MHWAAHGHTAAEIIAARADADRPNTGLTTWAGDVPRGMARISDPVGRLRAITPQMPRSAPPRAGVRSGLIVETEVMNEVAI